MDIAWIQVFVLTLAECIAPAGKTVCQEHELELQFLSRAECETALQQLVSLKDESDSVIVDKSRSGCAPSARQQTVYASVEDVAVAVDDKINWKAPGEQSAPSLPTENEHSARLESLPACEQTDGAPPCKVGNIIVEDMANAKKVDVWRSN